MVVDVHSHIYPRDYLDLLTQRQQIPRLESREDGEHLIIFPDERNTLGATRPISPAFSDLSEKTAFMQKNGIDQSVLSIGNPWLDFLPRREGAWWATRLNDWLQDQCQRGERFRAFGVIAPQAPEESAVEIERIAEFSHMDGIILGTRPGRSHLDSRALDPIWRALEATGLLAFIHPHYVAGYDWMGGMGHALPLALGFPFETAVATARLILAGTLDRHPGLRLLLAHGGGALPYLAARLETCVSIDGDASKHVTKPISEYVRALRYDAVVYSSNALKLTMATASSDQIAFGTDHPFGIARPDLIRRAITEAAPTEAVAQDMLYRNAARWRGEKGITHR